MDILMVLLFLNSQYSHGYPISCSVDPASNRVENAALNKPATQISTFSQWTASKAVDGNKNPNIWNGSCTHTLWENGLPLYQWWMVDLEKEYRIDSVSITNRLTEPERLRDFDIFVSLNSTFEEDDHMTDEHLCIHVSGEMDKGETRTFICQMPIFGQFIQIYMDTLDKRAMHICEVTVEGYPAVCIGENNTESVVHSKTPTSTIESMTTSTALPLPGNNTITATPTCPCGCSISLNTTNLTKEALVELVKELRKELTVNKKETSISKRKLVSVGDERQSAETIGFIGVLALCVPVLLIVSFDLINLWSFSKRK